MLQVAWHDEKHCVCREYLAKFGRVLHHNTDKGLLVAGRTAPRLNGGKVLEPMRLVVGDRAITEYKDKRINTDEIESETSVEPQDKQVTQFTIPTQINLISKLFTTATIKALTLNHKARGQ
ncbi:MAG: hypothetical protein KME29_22300 [Calothrix sp. FI2-JRJ7]|jgi:S-adenosylmethionine synthetase|nr:hypothetical protein [Calothrix sp. FI2-JRJ7]